jgi:hypothetical protein
MRSDSRGLKKGKNTNQVNWNRNINTLIITIKRLRWMKILTFALLGGVAGFAYYYFIGCQSGRCPITGNPYISTSYGLLLGVLFSLDKKKGTR